MGHLPGAIVATACAIGACRFDPSASTTDGGSPGADAATDSAPPLVDATACDGMLAFAPSNVDMCDLPAPQGALAVPAGETWTLDSTSGTLITELGDEIAPSSILAPQASAADLRIIVVSELAVVGRLDVVGMYPIAIVAAADATISGTVFAGAVGDLPGPGGNDPLSCSAGQGSAGVLQNTDIDLPGGTGAGGGAFGGSGGHGARVHRAWDAPEPPGGGPSGDASITPLRGGCRGGDGGNTGGGRGGAGGGGLQIVAAGTLRVEAGGVVAVPGGGGGGVTGRSSGGGGGGSGGAILLEAQTLIVLGSVTSHGGAGGEGSRSKTETGSGDDGTVDSPAPAAGGTGAEPQADGGDGGTGSSVAAAGQEGVTQTGTPSIVAGGGGGGGSVGRIRLRGVDEESVSGFVSPAPGD